MSYDAASRKLSISFKRDAREHVEVMMDSGRRFTAPRTTSPVFFYLGIIGTGIAISLVMEIYRRLLLPLYVEPEAISPLGVVLMQFLPLVLLFMLLIFALSAYGTDRRKRTLIARFEQETFIDIDIFRDGLCASSARDSITVDWSAIRDVLVEKQRILFESEGFVLYVPQRAFPDKGAFDAAYRDIRALWRNARRLNADRTDPTPGKP